MTADNLDHWINSVMKFKLRTEIEPMLKKFRKGFEEILDFEIFEDFEPDEFNILLGGQVIYPETLIPMVILNFNIFR